MMPMLYHGAGATDEVAFPLKPLPFLFMSSDMTAELLLGAPEADREVASFRYMWNYVQHKNIYVLVVSTSK